VSMRRDWKRWFLPATFLVLYMASVVLFFCNARYRLPIFPLLVLAGGAGLSRLPGLLREKNWSELLVYGGAGLVAALFLATNPPDNREAFQAANRGEGHKALGDHHAAAPLSDRSRHDIALAHFQEAVRLKPGSPYLRLALAREQNALGREGEARKLLGRAARQFSANAEVQLEFARALVASQQWVQALQQFESAVALQPAFGAAQQGLGCLLVRMGRFRQALEPLKTARQLQSNPLIAHLCAGSARLGLGQGDRALAEFSAALALDPLSASALQGIGDAHTLRGDLNPAIAHYRMALKQNANLPASSQNLASALGRIRQYPERISVLDAAVRQSPGDGELLAALAFALATTPQPHLRQGEQALGYAKRALAAHSPPAIEALDAQAAALAELNRFDAATKIALQALTLARAQGRSDRISGLERRLRGYRSGLPYRDPDPGAPPAP
ncbi:MAG TPA: tetratricopeptide repeat protein, partial [Myxococcales bacterium]|nr:tetratricopeptide repeat protein [Myxococcales bacterium]